MSKKDSDSNGMVIDGVAASEVTDSSGEVLEIKGVECSQMDDDAGILCNWEHEPGTKGASTIVGRVIELKKIMSAKDCDTDRQRDYWEKCRKTPYIYVKCRLFDGSGHTEAKAIAAIIRDNVAHGEPVAPRYSIEGSTLSKENGVIKSCIFKRLAITMRPCNRTAVSGLLHDPQGESDTVKSEPVMNPLFMKLGGEVDFSPEVCEERVVDLDRLAGNIVTIGVLAKALEAGSTDAAPSSLTGGAALQTEGLAARARDAVVGFPGPWDRRKFKEFAKASLPDVSDDFLDHFADVAEGFHLRKDVNGAVPQAKLTIPAKAAKVKKPAQLVDDLEDNDEFKDEADLGDGRRLERGTFRGQPVEVGGKGRPYFDAHAGMLHTPIGSFRAYLPQHDGPAADANYQKILSQPGIEGALDEATGNWLKAHRALKAGKTPPEMIMHAVLFSMLSPNKPVPVQELQFARLHDAMRRTGIDPRNPGFGAISPHVAALDQPNTPPELATDTFTQNKQYHLGKLLTPKLDAEGKPMGTPSSTGRFPGELHSTRPLWNDAMKRMEQYHTIHDKVVDLVHRHRHDMMSAVEEMMRNKHGATLRDAHVEGEDKPVAIPGLKVKTGLYTYGMLGGGNSTVPDTHFIRNMFGLDIQKDKDTVAYLKNLLWRPTNTHLMRAYNDWYVRNHPAAQYTLNHPKWGKHFAGSPQDAAFPSFWRHWLTIQPHEKFLGMRNAAANEATTHEPYWAAVRPLLKSGHDFDHNLCAKTAAVHQRYAQLYGEVPAMMMYYKHLAPELLDAAVQRERGEKGYAFLAKALEVESAGVELRKAVSEALEPQKSAPVVRMVSVQTPAGRRVLGRYMLKDGQVHHLEDWFGVLKKLLPEGPVNADKIARMHGLSWAPHMGVEDHEVPSDQSPPAPLLEDQEHPAPPPAAVFSYQRAGHSKPHVLEFGPAGAALDGTALKPEETQLLLDNANRGLATVKYHRGEALSKAEGDVPDAVAYMRHLLGEDHPHVKALTQHIYNDHMVPGVGNAYAWKEFRAKNRPGAYVYADMNGLKTANDMHGHQAGDDLIVGGFGALREAAAKVGTGKLFRTSNGGDEGVAHFPTYDEAAQFVRHARTHLEALPPVGGTHRPSFSFGIAADPATADKAMYHAKARKKDPVTGQDAFPVGRVPNLGHSLFPGAEGALKMHDEAPPVPKPVPQPRAA